MSCQPAQGAGGGGVDSTNLNNVAEQAKQLYAEIQQLALDFERDTAGAKLGRDKAKAVQG